LKKKIFGAKIFFFFPLFFFWGVLNFFIRILAKPEKKAFSNKHDGQNYTEKSISQTHPPPLPGPATMSKHALHEFAYQYKAKQMKKTKTKETKKYDNN
jgi:hypothetical protein